MCKFYITRIIIFTILLSILRKSTKHSQAYIERVRRNLQTLTANTGAQFSLRPTFAGHQRRLGATATWFLVKKTRLGGPLSIDPRPPLSALITELSARCLQIRSSPTVMQRGSREISALGISIVVGLRSLTTYFREFVQTERQPP